MICDVIQTEVWETVPVSSCEGQTGPEGVVIRDVIGLDSPYLPIAQDLFTAIFPAYTRYLPDLAVCALQQSPAHPEAVDHLWVIEKAGKPIGVRVFRYLHPRNVGYGAFIGLLEPYRDHGICSWLVKETMVQLCADAHLFGWAAPLGYVVEVAPVSAAKDEVDRITSKRRIAFHLKNDAYLLNVDYYEPPTIEGSDIIAADDVVDVAPAPMELAFYPVLPGTRLTEAHVITEIEALYFDYYHLAPDNEYVQRAIASVKARTGTGRAAYA
jgi:hypothetical protein